MTAKTHKDLMTDEEIFKVIDALPTEAKAAIRGVVDEIRREANAKQTDAEVRIRRMKYDLDFYKNERAKWQQHINWWNPEYLHYIIKSNHVKRKAQVARWKGEAEQYLSIVKQMEKEQRDDEKVIKELKGACANQFADNSRLYKEIEALKSSEALCQRAAADTLRTTTSVDYKRRNDEWVAYAGQLEAELRKKHDYGSVVVDLRRENAGLNRVIDTVASEKRTAVARLIAQNKALVTRARFWQTQAQKKTRYVTNHKWILQRQGRDLQAALKACFAAETKSQELVGKLHAASIEIQHLNLQVSLLVTTEALEWEKKSSPSPAIKPINTAVVTNRHSPGCLCIKIGCTDKNHCECPACTHVYLSNPIPGCTCLNCFSSKRG